MFFDVGEDPPKNVRPARLLSYIEFLDHVYHAYLKRNAANFKWAEGEEAPIDPADEEDDDDTDA
jgi:hypothetical protein